MRGSGRPPIRLIAHLSDLHFGRVDSRVVAPLVEAVHAERPDLVVISGDFVQNGTRAEFEQAGEFVRQLPVPLLMVPGNHDLPFANPLRRLTVGLDYYRRYISPELEPFFMDSELAVMGVNTARMFPLRNGRISQEQVRRIEEKLCAEAGGRVRILVTHHPFDLNESHHRRELVGRARMAMGRLAQSIDILLAGHMHMSQSGWTAVRYRMKGASAVFVQAGTATSTRGRGEPNRFNLLRIDSRVLTVHRRQWSTRLERFVEGGLERFTLDREAVCTLPNVTAAVPEEVEAELPSDR